MDRIVPDFLPLPPTNFDPGNITPNLSPGSVQSIMSQSQEKVSPSTTSLCFPTESIKYGTMFRFVAYKYDLQQTNAQLIDSVSGAQIFLPLPSQLNVQQGIDYVGVDAGAVGAVIKASKSAVQSLLDGKLSKDSMTDIASDVGKSAGAAGDYVLRKFADSLLPGAGAQVDQIMGSVVNPYNVATFRNSQTRSHQLDFVLIPRSSEESRSIKHICDTFIWHSLPSSGTGIIESTKIQGQAMFLNMPDEVEISFYGSSSLYKFARSVITNVAINYAPFGEPSFFSDGAPTAVHLSLSIQEIQQLTQRSYSSADASSFSDSTAAQSDANGVVSDTPPRIGGG